MMKLFLAFGSIAALSFGEPQAGGTIVTGTVALNGEAPPGRVHKITCPKCAPLYAQGQPREDLRVDQKNRIQGAFVYVKSGLDKKVMEPPKSPVLLDLKGCRFEPHVFGVQAGQELILRNSDPHAHCVRALSLVNREFLIHLERAGAERPRRFDAQEVMIELKDETHPWMNAWMAVLAHPYYAVTKEGGAFEIKNLPPGKYVIEVWQERCATKTQEIEVAEGRPVTANLVLDLKKQ